MTLQADLGYATEGSREFDYRIFSELNGAMGEYRQGTERFGDSVVRDYIELGGAGTWCDEVPAYTTSIDAALTLVPEGWSFAVEGFPVRACVYDPAAMAGDSTVTATAVTPALAIVLAALKARDAAE